MGWSARKDALDAFDALLTWVGRDDLPTNVWENEKGKFFAETGKENADGAVTGTVWRFVDENRAVKAGSFRIEPNGVVTRFPGVTKAHREAASLIAEAKSDF